MCPYSNAVYLSNVSNPHFIANFMTKYIFKRYEYDFKGNKEPILGKIKIAYGMLGKF